MSDTIPWILWGLFLGSFIYLWHRHYIRRPREMADRAVKTVAMSEKKKEVTMSTFKGWEWSWSASRKSRNGGDMPASEVLDQVLLQEIRDLMSHAQDTVTLKDLIRENTKELKQLNAFLRQVYGDPE
jgi:hypothetical protein